jgi:hypothetical protein
MTDERGACEMMQHITYRQNNVVAGLMSSAFGRLAFQHQAQQTSMGYMY